MFPKTPLARRVSSVRKPRLRGPDPAISSSFFPRPQTRPPPSVHFSPNSTTGSIFPAPLLPGHDSEVKTAPGGRNWRGIAERPAQILSNRCSWSAFCHPFLGNKVNTIGPFFLSLQHRALPLRFTFILDLERTAASIPGSLFASSLQLSFVSCILALALFQGFF